MRIEIFRLLFFFWTVLDLRDTLWVTKSETNHQK